MAKTVSPDRSARKTAAKERAQSRRKARNQAQRAAHVSNRELIAAGGSTAWQMACEARRVRHTVAKSSGQWKAADRTTTGLIRRTDAHGHSYLDDPGIKDRAKYLGISVAVLRGGR